MSKNAAGGGLKARVSAAIALLSGLASAEEDESKSKKESEGDQPEDETKNKNGEGEQPADEKKDEEEPDGDEGDKGKDAPADGDPDDEEKDKETAASAKSRIGAILKSPHAKGREALAQTLALQTDLSVKDAEAVLQKTPKATGGPGSLDGAMAREGAPPINGGGGGGEETAETVATRLAGYVNAKRPKK